jgi:hypothetical protein
VVVLVVLLLVVGLHRKQLLLVVVGLLDRVGLGVRGGVELAPWRKRFLRLDLQR